MNKTQTYTINPDNTNVRIDLFISKINNGHSRSAWQKLIKEGYVKVNGETVDPKHKLRTGDTVVSKPYDKDISIDIEEIYTDDDVIVVNKPRGVISHAKSDLESEPSVASFARDRVEKSDSIRSGIVHRLDRETSGVMIVARNQVTEDYLKQQFENRTLDKWYLAICSGDIQEAISIEDPIARSPSKSGKFTTSETGRPAKTIVFPLKTIGDKTLVLAKPITGRTHQIRVHLKFIGHAIIGDSLYSSKKSLRKKTQDTLLLHAWRLTISIPSKEKAEFVADIPEDMSKYIDNDDIRAAERTISHRLGEGT